VVVPRKHYSIYRRSCIEYLPHLTLNKPQALDNRVSHTSIGNRVWASGVVVRAIDEVIPHLAVPIQGSLPVTIPCDALSTEQPGTALVLVAHRKGVVEPVLDVLVPYEGALLVDVDVAETSRVHDRLDRVDLVEEHHLAPAGGVIVAAVLEGLDDRRCRVGAVGPGLHDACLVGSLREDKRQLQRRRDKGPAHGERHDRDEEGLATERHCRPDCPRFSRAFYTGENREPSGLNTPLAGPLCRHWGSRFWSLGIGFCGGLQDICADPGFPWMYLHSSGAAADGTRAALEPVVSEPGTCVSFQTDPTQVSPELEICPLLALLPRRG
jgi:hypothetical protein